MCAHSSSQVGIYICSSTQCVFCPADAELAPLNQLSRSGCFSLLLFSVEQQGGNTLLRRSEDRTSQLLLPAIHGGPISFFFLD